MSVLTLYILRQILVPLIIATLTLSGIVWLTQSLYLLDRVVLAGQGLVVWLELLLYTMPSVLAFVLLISFFIAVLYAFYRLFMDKEIITMFAAGVATTRLMRPVVILSFFIITLILGLEFYIAPWTNQLLKQRSLEINADVANAMLRPGIFTNPARGITAFIRARDEKGFVYGVFFQDSRDKKKSVSYTAESGTLVYNKGKTHLLMFNGHAQHYDKNAEHGGITLIKFERYSYDLSQLVRVSSSAILGARELYPHQIYDRWFNEKTSAAQKKDIFLFVNRVLLRAFYVFAYGFIVLAIFLPAQINRQGYAKRIRFAIVVAIALFFSPFPLLTNATNNVYYFALLYIIPIVVTLLALFVCLRGVGFVARFKHRIATQKINELPATSAAGESG